MGFNQPLTVDQYALIHSQSYASDWLIWLCTNRVVLHGTVDDNLSSDPTWLKFNYTTITGDFADVEPMQAILISQTDDIATALYRGRITEDAADATYVNINEGGATFSAGAYFWVIDTYDITYRAWKPSTLDPQTAQVLIDGSITYRPQQPAIQGTEALPLRTAYVGLVDPDTTKMRIVFDVSDSYAAESGATITDYLFTFAPGTYTVISGALDTAIVTVDIDDNTEQWGKLEVTDSNGTVSTRRLYISTLPPVVGFKPTARISDTLSQGWTMTIPAFAGVDGVLNNTFAVVGRTVELFDGVRGTLYADNNIMFIGWMQRETDELKTDPSAGILSPVNFEFTGVMARMARLVNQPFVFEESSSPTRWGQITTLTPWRAIKAFLDNFSTVTWLCQLEFDSVDATFNFPDITTQGGNLMDAVNGMAGQISLLMEFAADGRIGGFTDFTYLDANERLDVPVIADWQAKDAVKDGITKTQEENANIGKVNGSGAFLFTTVQQVLAYTVAAPSLDQGESQGADTLSAQILAATDTPEDALEELEYRVGSKYNLVNNSLFLDVTHRATIYGGNASHSEFYAWTIDETIAGASGLHRIIYDDTTQWACEGVTYTRAPNGKVAVKYRYRYVQAPGSKGINTTQQPQGSVVNPLPDLGLPAFDFELPEMTFPDAGLANVNPAQLNPPPNRVAKVDGSTLLAWAANQLMLLGNVIALTTPKQRSIQPPGLGDFEHQSAIFDPLNLALTPTLAKPSPSHYAYDLVSDGTDSKVLRAADVFNPTPIWLTGDTMDGLYTLLRGTSVDGGLMTYTPGGVALDTVNFTYNIGTGPASAQVGDTITMTSTLYLGNIDYIYFGADANIRMDITAEDNWNPFTDAGSDRVGYTLASGVFVSYNGASGFNPIDLPPTTELKSSNPLLETATFQCATQHSLGAVTLHITILEIIDPSVGAKVRYSSDRGDTWGSALAIGNRPGAAGGFDVQRSGTVSYAACTGKVRKATALGGAYSDHTSWGTANPVCVIIPWYERNSTTSKNTTGGSPQYIVALDAPDTGSRTLIWVDGDGTKHDITPVAGITFDNANCITTFYGNHIMCFGLVSGVYKVYRSTNGGTSWSLVETSIADKFIRGRRGDNRKPTTADAGQVFLANSTNKLGYSSKWSSAGLSANNRDLSFNILGFDPLG